MYGPLLAKVKPEVIEKANKKSQASSLRAALKATVPSSSVSHIRSLYHSKVLKLLDMQWIQEITGEFQSITSYGALI